MKLTINGSPSELADLLFILAGMDAPEKDQAALVKQIEKVAEENSPGPALSKINLHEAIMTTMSPTAEPVKEKKTRRTKEQIAADNFKDPADQDQPEDTKAGRAAANVDAAQETIAAPKSSGIDREELKDFVLSRVEEKPENAEKIRAKLTAFGVTRAGQLKEEQLNDMWVFLQAL